MQHSGPPVLNVVAGFSGAAAHSHLAGQAPADTKCCIIIAQMRPNCKCFPANLYIWANMSEIRGASAVFFNNLRVPHARHAQ